VAIDKKQLGYSVQSIYGQNMDVDGYLRRFFDLEYNLPEPPQKVYTEYLFQKYELQQHFSHKINSQLIEESEYLLRMLKELIYIFNFSLRKQVQIFTQLSIILRTVQINEYIFPDILALLLTLKEQYFDLYDKFINNTVGAEEILAYLESIPKSKDFFEDDGFERFKTILLWFTFNDKNKKDYFDNYTNISKNPKASNDERYLANQRLHIWTNNKRFNPSAIRNQLKQKIELTANFANE
jgi:hypothetical protein